MSEKSEEIKRCLKEIKGLNGLSVEALAYDDDFLAVACYERRAKELEKRIEAISLSIWRKSMEDFNVSFVYGRSQAGVV